MRIHEKIYEALGDLGIRYFHKKEDAIEYVASSYGMSKDDPDVDMFICEVHVR
jgi:hypothetical protein